MPTGSETSAFLAQVKASLKSRSYHILDKRQKYISTLAQLGIVQQDVINDINGLTVNENWLKEPDNNPTFPGDVWQCKKILYGQCIYIKLKIQLSNNGFLLIMSYHIDGM